jgi:hypothetical protein
MTRRPQATVRILTLPHLHPDAVRIEIDCRYSTTGLTSVPGPRGTITKPKMVTAAVFEHEARCGDCDTSEAHAQGDQKIRAMADEAWGFITAEVARLHVAGRRN